MHSSEPARKKLKVSAEHENAQEPAKARVELVDGKRDPSNAVDTCDASDFQHSSAVIAAAAAASQDTKLTIFVLDTASRLFAAGKYLQY